MEKLGEAQTHCILKNMMKEVGTEHDDNVSFREFLRILRKQHPGKIQELAEKMKLESVDVAEVGVSGSKSFFEAKQLEAKLGKGFQDEMYHQHEAAKKAKQEELLRKKTFKERIASFDK